MQYYGHKYYRRIPVTMGNTADFNGASPPREEAKVPALPAIAAENEDWRRSPQPRNRSEPATAIQGEPGTSPSDSPEVVSLRSQLADVEDRWKRAAADLDNYRKRFDRELERMRQLERETILRAWFTVVDDIERALCVQGASSNPWYEGMEAIRERMLAVLAQFGVKPFVPQGEMFNPEQHEAVATAHLPNEPEGKIVEVVASGYRIEDRILRPAKVIAVKR